MSSAPLSGLSLYFPPNLTKEDKDKSTGLFANLREELEKINVIKGQVEIIYMGLNGNDLIHRVTTKEMITDALATYTHRYQLICFRSIPFLNQVPDVINKLMEAIDKMEAVKTLQEIAKKEANKDKPHDLEAVEDYKLERSLMDQWDLMQIQRCRLTLSLINQLAQSFFNRSQKTATALDYLKELSLGGNIGSFPLWKPATSRVNRISINSPNKYHFHEPDTSDNLLKEPMHNHADYLSYKQKFIGVIDHFNRIRGEAELVANAVKNCVVVDLKSLTLHTSIKPQAEYIEQLSGEFKEISALAERFNQMMALVMQEIKQAPTNTKEQRLLCSEQLILQEMVNAICIRSHRASFAVASICPSYIENNLNKHYLPSEAYKTISCLADYYWRYLTSNQMIDPKIFSAGKEKISEEKENNP